jgi:hypothetical protein
MKRNNEPVSIESFINFYSDKIMREENAQYLRQNKGQPENSGTQKKPQKALILQTNFQQRKPQQIKPFQNPRWKNFNNDKNQHQLGIDLNQATKEPQHGKQNMFTLKTQIISIEIDTAYSARKMAMTRPGAKYQNILQSSKKSE